jgi:flagellar motor switch/type III secretory pathway protein FliN
MSTAAVQVRAQPAEQASAPDPEAVLVSDEVRWQRVMPLPCDLSVAVPMPNFKVRDFLGLRIGSVIRTDWSLGRDVPLRVNHSLIGWGELEGTSTHLAVRLTGLAAPESRWKEN